MINSNAVYVVFTPNPVFEGIAGTMLVQYTPSGYHLAPYPMANDEIKFTGSYLECDFILHALLDYNPNQERKMSKIYEDDIDENPYPDCPTCGEHAGFMGWLGNLKWFRCLFCGLEFSIKGR